MRLSSLLGTGTGAVTPEELVTALRLRNVAALRHQVRRGSVPQPDIKLSDRIYRWSRESLLSWLEAGDQVEEAQQ